ncbi:MAG: hypothetical protein MUE53_03675 [Chitinophagales bacterium]|nr:hypothetical protein [Chitinophagales bacterium]
MIDFFKLQFILLNRKIKDAGLNPLLGYLLGLIAFFLISEFMFNKTNFAKYLVILTGLSIQFKFSEKDRMDFLISTFGNIKKIKIRLIENFIIAIPFIFILLLKSSPFEALVLFFCSIISALFSFYSDFNLTIPTPFSKRPFEFSTGFRKSFLIFPFTYALTVFSINIDNLNLGIFALLLVFITILSFYNVPENEFYVWIYADTPRDFLMKKVLNAIKNASLLVAPIIISLLIFYTKQFKLILISFFIGQTYLSTIILAKYSAYPRNISISEGLLIALSLYFPPLLIAFIPMFYSKSIGNVKYLLND